jgi:hypothetical protein
MYLGFAFVLAGWATYLSNAASQRNPTFEASHEFLSSSPDRPFSMLVQFGHFLPIELWSSRSIKGNFFSWREGS